MTKLTAPKPLAAGGDSDPAGEVNPLAANERQLADLGRMLVETGTAENDEGRVRLGKAFQTNAGLLARLAAAHASGVSVPVTLADELSVERIAEALPELLRLLANTAEAKLGALRDKRQSEMHNDPANDKGVN
jgi:hypothetical protein